MFMFSGNQNLSLIATSALAISLALVSYVYFYIQNRYTYWSRRGIRGPKPRFLLGNMREMLSNDRPKLERQWAHEYGKVYGIYEGLKPVLVIADPELLVQICIKDFDQFPNHRRMEFTNKYQKSFIFVLQDDHWRKVRALMSPTFTSGKIKRMFKFLDDCAEDLIQNAREQIEKNQPVVNLNDLYNLFAMDAITTCCYGLRVERSPSLANSSSRTDFVQAAKSFSHINVVRILIANLVPDFILKLVDFQVKPEYQLKSLLQIAGGILESRRKSSKKFDDYLQMLLDAKLDDQLELNEMDLEENHHASLTRESLLDDQSKLVQEINLQRNNDLQNSTSTQKKVALSDIEILAASIFLLSVGLDTTGILLTNTTYLLAFHKEIQEKLYQELMQIKTKRQSKITGQQFYSFDYESLTTCKYLDAILSESLRLLTPVIAIDRIAKTDYHLEKHQIHLPKQSKLNLAFHAIMNDPDNWLEPEKFQPERFLPENKDKIKPGTYCPFGVGPRHCIGMRFSLTESKLALAKLVANFEFKPAPGTQFPPQFTNRFVLCRLKDPRVELVPRSVTE